MVKRIVCPGNCVVAIDSQPLVDIPISSGIDRHCGIAQNGIFVDQHGVVFETQRSLHRELVGDQLGVGTDERQTPTRSNGKAIICKRGRGREVHITFTYGQVAMDFGGVVSRNNPELLGVVGIHHCAPAFQKIQGCARIHDDVQALRLELAHHAMDCGISIGGMDVKSARGIHGGSTIHREVSGIVQCKGGGFVRCASSEIEPHARRRERHIFQIQGAHRDRSQVWIGEARV